MQAKDRVKAARNASRRSTPIVAVALLTLGACASPLVRYEAVVAEDREGKSKFQIAESLVKFDYGKTAAGIVNEGVILIASVPTPYGTDRYALSGTTYYQNWGVDTKLQITYRGDTTLPQEIGVEVADRRLEFAQGAAQAIVGAAALLSLGQAETGDGSPTTKLPKGIDVTAFLASPPSTCTNSTAVRTKPEKLVKTLATVKDIDRNAAISCTEFAVPDTDSFKLSVEIGSVPVDAVSADVLASTFDSHSYYYSACRTMNVVLTSTDPKKTQKIAATLSVADPAWLQTLRFPDKGKITVLPSCGANSVASDAKLPTGMDYINGLISAAKAIKDGMKKGGTQ
jgi:hypothetical protein